MIGQTLPRFQPQMLSEDTARALHRLFTSGRYADTRCYPKIGPSSLTGEALIALGLLRGVENCWNQSTFGRMYQWLLSKRAGPLAGLLFELFWLGRTVPTSRLVG